MQQPAEPGGRPRRPRRREYARFVVSGSGAKLRPGCRDIATGRVVAVPLRDGAQDWAELGRCLARVKEQFPWETIVIVSADPSVPCADVANAMVTARGSRVEPLFPVIIYTASVS